MGHGSGNMEYLLVTRKFVVSRIQPLTPRKNLQTFLVKMLESGSGSAQLLHSGRPRPVLACQFFFLRNNMLEA